MSHDPAQDAAAYLGGALTEKKGRAFEQHLLQCDQCWTEVTRARSGRMIAESVREMAPQSLRERIRTSVDNVPAGRPRFQARWLMQAGVAVLVVLVGMGMVGLMNRGPTPGVQQPEPVAQAIVDFQNRRVPAEEPASHEPLDLTEIGFTVAGAGAGKVGDLVVDGYSYRDADGRRLQLYMSSSPFPEAAGARITGGPDGPWNATSQGIEMLCVEYPMSLLALTDSPGVLEELSAYLKTM